LRVVHVIRDSRGVAYSWSKRVRKPEIVETDEFMPVYSPLKSAMLWNVHNGLFETLAATGVPSMRVRYEDLLRSTETEIARVLHFAGLDPDPEAMAFLGDGSVELGVNHTVAGNPMRFTTGQLALRTDEAWRNAMPAPRRRAVSALTAPLRMAYGYTTRNDQPRNQPSDAVETPR
jgi:hypothetical protein